MISRDPAIFEEGAEVRARMREYGAMLEELHIIVCAPSPHSANVFSEKKKDVSQIAEHTFAYATRSSSKFMRVWDGYGIAERILKAKSIHGEGWIITAQDPFETGLLGWILRMQFKRARLQLQVHTDFLSPYFARESFKNLIRVWFARFFLPRADFVRVVSRRIEQSLRACFGMRIPRIVVLPIFVDVHRKMPRVRELRTRYGEHDFIILMASRLSREKNISLALRAFAKVKSQLGENPLLLLVGEGSEKANLQALVHAYHIEDDVMFEPWTRDLTSYYAAADCFLLTSNYEGYGRTVVEAMSAGLPVVMTDVGLAGEVLHDEMEGIVIPVADESALEVALITLAHDPQKRKQLGVAARNAVRSFPTKEQYLERYTALFQP